MAKKPFILHFVTLISSENIIIIVHGKIKKTQNNINHRYYENSKYQRLKELHSYEIVTTASVRCVNLCVVREQMY